MLRAHLHSLLLSAAIGLGLAAVPFGMDQSGLSPNKTAWAKNGGNGGGGGGNGGGNAGGKGGGKGGGKANGNAGGKASGKGQQAHAGGLRAGKSKAPATGIGAGPDGLHPSQLGKLNGFMNASEQARMNAAPNSAVGQISHAYADALADYAAARGSLTGAEPTAMEDVAVALADAAAAFAAAANKTVSPDVVKAVNGELGTLSDLSADEQDAIAHAISDVANAAQTSDDLDAGESRRDR